VGHSKEDVWQNGAVRCGASYLALYMPQHAKQRMRTHQVLVLLGKLQEHHNLVILATTIAFMIADGEQGREDTP
jgi:hypothetical protein